MNENYNPTNQKAERSFSEKPALFSEAVEKIKANERAIKLINLMENGFLLSQEDMDVINIKDLVGGLRIKYPTIDDIQMDLMQTVEDQIGVAYEEGRTNEQHEQACKIKQNQYEVAVEVIINALSPIYEKYGAIESENIKNTAWNNIDDFINYIDPDNISEVEKEYLRKSLSALAKQKLNTEEERLIMQIRTFIESGPEPQVENAKGIESNNQENVENLITKKESDIFDFKEYVKNNYQKIERELQQGRDLDDIFYHDFYSGNNDNLKYKENNPITQELKIKYATSIKKVREEFENGKKRNISVMKDPYWIYCKVNQGVVNYNNLGRFYLNLEPEYVGNIFTKTLELCQMSGLHVEMKIPTNGNASTFNRHDKMVIYFNAEEENKMMSAINMLYNNNNGAFSETGTPRFATGVKNLNNEKMKGVGFGEEPNGFDNKISFGQVRTKILEGVYQDAKYQGLSINDSRFNFNSSFEFYCEKFQVDPKNPAFNISDSQHKFSTIKRMTE